jgi:transcriptional regulator GlxA family with amidase domain
MKEVEGNTYYRLFISNKRELQKLEDQIGFRIQRKNERLEDATEGNGGKNKDLIPNCSELIHQARKNSEIPYSRKTLRRRLESYEYERRKPTRSGLKEILDSFEFDSTERTSFLRKLTETDVFWDQIESISEGNKELVDWIKKQYKEGAEVASICTGAFLLASSGLLDGKSCSTHWSVADNFRSMFPEVDLQKDKLITDEDGIYTNGGAYSFLNLIIYLVEKYYDRQTAIFCSKVFQIEMDRQNQSAFIIFKGQKMHEDEIVKEAQDYIESNTQKKISIKQLASRFAVSRRQFDRRFIEATGNTPFEYLQRVKVEVAKKLLETGRKTVSEVMYEVGYSDASAFRKVFKEITSLSPVEYRNRYNREAVV